MPNKVITTTITVNKKEQQVGVECIGNGSIPILVTGHAEVYGPMLENAFAAANLLDKYKILIPRTYWTTNAPLANLLPKEIEKFILDDLVNHLEEIRKGLESQELLKATQGKVMLYGHSFFHVLAFQYALTYPDSTMMIIAEGPPPYNSPKWGDLKMGYFNANFPEGSRRDALKKTGIPPDGSAVDDKSMQDFSLFKESYQQMSSTLFFSIEQKNPVTHEVIEHNHIDEIWGKNELNMAMMKKYFPLTNGYDARTYNEKLTCPIFTIFGLYDTAAPPVEWIDTPGKLSSNCGEEISNSNGTDSSWGVGFFAKQNRAYYIGEECGHWPLLLEKPKEAVKQLDKFVTTTFPQFNIDATEPENKVTNTNQGLSTTNAFRP